MHNSIALKAILVAKMVNLPVKRTCKNTQIADTKRLEQQSHRIQIANQIVRSKTQCRHCNRWIDKITSVRSTYCGL